MQSVHKRKTCLCSACDHIVTPKGHLRTHKQSVHEWKKYPCDVCDYLATGKGSLSRHKQSVHEGKSIHVIQVTTLLLVTKS